MRSSSSQRGTTFRCARRRTNMAYPYDDENGDDWYYNDEPTKFNALDEDDDLDLPSVDVDFLDPDSDDDDPDSDSDF